jgi:APA family basic amino acid/polyamine antiporter
VPAVKDIHFVAAACGTAVASICAVGVAQLEGCATGIWAALAVAAGAVPCFFLARVFARLCQVVPSGAGPLAYLSRAFGKRAGLFLAAPYFAFTLLLGGAEALVLGWLLERTIHLPAWLGASGFLAGTWALCRSGVKIGYRVQTAATILLLVGLAALSLFALHQHGWPSSPAPTPLGFLAACGQSLFLFMGFELVTTQIEVAASPLVIARALKSSVWILAAFYSLLALGMADLRDGGDLLPQLALGRQAGPIGVAVIVVLSLLASFTSLNGALLGLGRFVAALGRERLLPPALARIDGRTLVPRAALDALLILALAAAAVIGRILPLLLGGAAAVAALLYLACAFALLKPPFRKVAHG